MNGNLPKVLILGHSFVKRLKHDLVAGFDPRAHDHFDLGNSARVSMYGVGGRKASDIQSRDLHIIEGFVPDILILEIGTNDLNTGKPEIIGSAIDDLIVYLRAHFSIRVVVVCQVIPRRNRRTGLPALEFNERANILNQYLSVVVGAYPWAFTWEHKYISSLSRPCLLADGVHLNASGQHVLYRSYRGAILQALRLLQVATQL